MKNTLISAFILVCALSFFSSEIYAAHLGLRDPVENVNYLGFVHPFLLDHAMPDSPGSMNFRANGIFTTLNGHADYGFGAHLEAGLIDRLGINIKNNYFQQDGTEVMLQYALFRSHDKVEGISLSIGERYPGATGETTAMTTFGISALKLIYGQPLHLNLHVDTQSHNISFGAAQIFKYNEKMTFIIEYSSYSASTLSSSILEAVKFNLTHYLNLGIAFETPTVGNKTYDSRTMLQIEAIL